MVYCQSSGASLQCACEDEGGRVVSNQTLGCVMIQCVYVKMKGEGL